MTRHISFIVAILLVGCGTTSPSLEGGVADSGTANEASVDAGIDVGKDAVATTCLPSGAPCVIENCCSLSCFSSAPPGGPTTSVCE
jgi:hypothetical protein